MNMKSGAYSLKSPIWKCLATAQWPVGSGPCYLLAFGIESFSMHCYPAFVLGQTSNHIPVSWVQSHDTFSEILHGCFSSSGELKKFLD